MVYASSIYIEFRFRTFRIRHYFLTMNGTKPYRPKTELVPYSDIHCKSRNRTSENRKSENRTKKRPVLQTGRPVFGHSL